jgi:predicted nucleic acid-binding protein
VCYSHETQDCHSLLRVRRSERSQLLSLRLRLNAGIVVEDKQTAQCEKVNIRQISLKKQVIQLRVAPTAANLLKSQETKNKGISFAGKAVKWTETNVLN